MTYRQSHLQPAFGVAGTHAFTVWGYGTTDLLEDVLRPGYMHGLQAVLRPGDLIYVRTEPRRDRPDQPLAGETRLAVVMVCGWDPCGTIRLRLVQDFGRRALHRDLGMGPQPAPEVPGLRPRHLSGRAARV